MTEICLRCGKPLGVHVATQKYCLDCRAVVLREQYLARRARYNAEAAQARQEREAKKPPLLSKRDMAYCSRCEYKGNFAENYLCDYIGASGHKRGCKAGAGCERRSLRHGDVSNHAR